MDPLGPNSQPKSPKTIDFPARSQKWKKVEKSGKSGMRYFSSDEKKNNQMKKPEKSGKQWKKVEKVVWGL